METKKFEINGKEFLVEIEAFDVKDELNEPIHYSYKGTNATVKRDGVNILIRKYDDEESVYAHNLRKEEVRPDVADNLKVIAKELFGIEVISYLTDEGYKP